MSEIELLQSFREDVPDPDGATVRAARAVLMERIEASRGRGHRSGRSSARRIALGLAAATAALVAVALVLPILLPRGANRATAAELRRLAATAAQKPAPQPLGPGDFYYLRQEGRERITVVTMDHGAYSALTPVVFEYWVGEDGSGRLVTTPGELLWPGPRDKIRWEAEGPEQLFGPHDQAYGPGELVGSEYPGTAFAALPRGYDFEMLPRDPEALYEVIKTAAAAWESTDAGEVVQPTPLGAFVLAIQLLRTPLTPPDVRAALFQAIAYIPGITIDAYRTIPGMGAGAVVFQDALWGEVRVRIEFLVDPATSELLGEQLILLDRADWIDAEPPFVMDFMAYSRPRVVGSTSERP